MNKFRMAALIFCAIAIVAMIINLLIGSANPWYDIIFRVAFSVATLIALKLAYKADKQKGKNRLALAIVVSLLPLFLIVTVIIDIINL
ncbi:hypothetical protein ACI2JA_06355 [Alkalihalobacillus sp. NPDC078783]